MPPVKHAKLTDEVEAILAAASRPMTRKEIFKLATLAHHEDDISRTLHQLHCHGRASRGSQSRGPLIWAKPGVLQMFHAQPAVAKNTGSTRLVISSHPPAEARAVAATPHRPADTTAPVGSDVSIYDMIGRMNSDEFGHYIGHLSRMWACMQAARP